MDLVLNPTNILAVVKINHVASGAKDSVNIQPRGRVNLEDGWEVDASYLQNNPSIIVKHDNTH